jgi:hypothetical protein
MAALDVSTVVALTNKSFELLHAGHRARSEEYERRALAAAQALGAEDCLIVAKLQHFVGSTMYKGVFEQHAAPPSSFAPVLPFLFAAAATVQRRKADGTLLAGSCRAAEVTFDQLIAEHMAGVVQDRGMLVGAPALSCLMGYKTFLEVASFAINVYTGALQGKVLLTQEQLRTCVVLMADAVELMLHPLSHPRVDEQYHIGAEGQFVQGVQHMGMLPRLILLHGDAAGARLLHGLRRLNQSGVLQRRRVDVAIKLNRRDGENTRSAAGAAAAAPGLRRCALETCGAREQHPSHFKSCGACRGVAYCCKEHQAADWPAHKAACKAARKAMDQAASS